MSDVIIQNPVLNSPFAEPTRQLSSKSLLTAGLEVMGEALEGQRIRSPAR